MEVRSTPIAPGAQGQENARFLIDQGELRSILSNLSHELCRPLVSLRAGFDLLLGESPSTINQDQRGHLFTMVSLCDDLLRLTRSYLDYAGIVQGSRPLCSGFIHDRGLDRRDRPPVRPGRLGTPARVGIARRLSRERGGHRRLTLPADLRQSRLERREVHAGREGGCA